MIYYGMADEWQLGANNEVWFWVEADGKTIKCRVSEIVIQDYCQLPDTDDRLECAQSQYDRITDIVGRKIALGQFEQEDGTILVRSEDW